MICQFYCIAPDWFSDHLISEKGFWLVADTLRIIVDKQGQTLETLQVYHIVNGLREFSQCGLSAFNTDFLLYKILYSVCIFDPDNNIGKIINWER